MIEKNIKDRGRQIKCEVEVNQVGTVKLLGQFKTRRGIIIS